MTPYINEVLIEVNEFPKYDDFGNPSDYGNLHTIKDYFHYKSTCEEYGYRGMVILKSDVINTEDIPEETINKIIENKIPVLKKVINFDTKTETWVFVKTVLQGN
jgi:hypothetical protein